MATRRPGHRVAHVPQVPTLPSSSSTPSSSTSPRSSSPEVSRSKSLNEPTTTERDAPSGSGSVGSGGHDAGGDGSGGDGSGGDGSGGDGSGGDGSGGDRSGGVRRTDWSVRDVLGPTLGTSMGMSIGKGKERERGWKSGSEREVGSAMISLRQDVVERLADDDEVENGDQGVQGGGGTNGRAGGGASVEASGVPGPSYRQSSRTPSTRRPKPKSKDSQDDNQQLSRQPPNNAAISRQASRPGTTASASGSKIKRARAKSIHFPQESIDTDRNFYLPHYSIDRQYSLKPGDKDTTDNDNENKMRGDRAREINLELGLGGDFDVSFGEAMRRGVGGKEMPLPREALRVLSEAKENLEARAIGKAGRKGSLGMGLFKESRAAAAAAVGLGSTGLGEKVRKKRDQVVVEKDEDEDEEVEESEDGGRDEGGTVQAQSPHGRSRSTTTKGTKTEQSSPPTPSRGPLSIHTTTSVLRPRSRGSRDLLTDDPIQTHPTHETSAGIKIVSSPLLRDRTLASSRQGTIGPSPLDHDSSWTTTSEETSSMTGSEEYDRDRFGSDGKQSSYRSEEPTDVESEEEDRMTVPLQPFNHAVGGHSSIYKFTRRAVCKVGQTIVTRLDDRGLMPRC